jgi:hypothetical protein
MHTEIEKQEHDGGIESREGALIHTDTNTYINRNRGRGPSPS